MKKIALDVFALCIMAVISVSQVAKAAEIDEKIVNQHEICRTASEINEYDL